jgi:hypothetical protein
MDMVTTRINTNAAACQTTKKSPTAQKEEPDSFDSYFIPIW